MDLPRGWSIGWHRHDFHHELVLVDRGGMETDMEGRHLTTPAGWAKCHPCNVAHAEATTNAQPARILLLSWSGCDPAQLPRAFEDRSGRLRGLMTWAAELSRLHAPAADLDGVLAAVLVALRLGYRREDPLVERIRREVEMRIAEPIYLEELAATAGMSRFHFARAFRKASGRSPMAFVREARVAAVRGLIQSSDLPLKEIAARVGFADEYQLSRVFRQIAGIPPGAMRRMARAEG
jgi:AraC family transcriptional regulator